LDADGAAIEPEDVEVDGEVEVDVDVEVVPDVDGAFTANWVPVTTVTCAPSTT
jgi:hypothetical protein